MFSEVRVFCFKLGVLIGQTTFFCLIVTLKRAFSFFFSHLVDVKQKKETWGKREIAWSSIFTFDLTEKCYDKKGQEKTSPSIFPHLQRKKYKHFFKGFFCLSVKNEICIFLFLRAEKNAPGLYCGLSTKGENTTFSQRLAGVSH